MKTFSPSIYLLLTCCLLLTIGRVRAQTCSLTSAFTSSNSGTHTLTLFSTSSGTTAGTSYQWRFGNGASSPVNFGVATATYVYSTAGTFFATLVVNNQTAGCVDSSSQVVTVGSSCSLSASFAQNTATNPAQFSSTSFNTGPQTLFAWNFGDGSAALTGTALTNPSHSYTSNGSYVVILQIQENGCSSTAVQTITINNASCNLSASFNYTVLPSGLVSFTNTSSGAIFNTHYTWSFGDGSTSTVSPVTSHQYAGSNSYPVSLFASSTSSCTSNDSVFVIVPCMLQTTFIHTVSQSGMVIFGNTSTGTTSNTIYSWNFGDGVYGSGSMPVHTYMSAGAYDVSLRTYNNSFCVDSTVLSINITGISCIANPGFTLVPSSLPQHWNAIPDYPWNITAAVWDWGDGSSDSALYVGHTYASAAQYNICLSTTVSCGASGSACNSETLFKTEQQAEDQSILYVNVRKPTLTTSLKSNGTEQDLDYLVYPNPNTGAFNLRITGVKSGTVGIAIFNLLGDLVYEETAPSSGPDVFRQIQLNTPAAGIYFIKVSSKNATETRKIIVGNH